MSLISPDGEVCEQCITLFSPQELVWYQSRLFLCLVPAAIILQASSLYAR